MTRKITQQSRKKRNPGKYKSPKRSQGKLQLFGKRLFNIALLLLVISLTIVAGYVIYLDWIVQQKFEGKRWSIPAHVYARPLELYPGLSLSRRQFIEELNILGYERQPGAIESTGHYRSSGNAIEVKTRSFQFWDGDEPSRHIRITFSGKTIRRIQSHPNNETLPLVRLDPFQMGGIYPAQGEDRILLRLEDVPKSLIDLITVVEDRQFYEHYGVSVRGIIRAIYTNLKAGRALQGGSTLTQQLVKNLFLTHERTLWRKSREAVMAVLLELHYSKTEILEAYLNEIFLGQDAKRAVHGFGLASQFYFGKPISETSLAEQALLVGLAKGASYYNPRKHPDRARKRRNLVLQMAEEHQVATQVDVALARRAALGVKSRAVIKLANYPAYLDLVRRQLRRDYAMKDLTEEGLQVFTAFDPIVQNTTEEKLQTGIKQLSRRYGIPSGKLQGAAVVVDVQSGGVKAIVGSASPKFAGFNRALDAARPIGSLVKPVVYFTALSDSYSTYHLASVLQDEKINMLLPNGASWSPKNFDNKAHGEILFYQGLVHSYNLSTVNLGLDIGPARVANTIERVLNKTNIPTYPSILLGAINLSPLEVAQMYQVFASSGFSSSLRTIREVQTQSHQKLNRYPIEVKQILNAKDVYLINHTLTKVMQEGTAASVQNILPAQLSMAGKTGTTNDNRDSWFAGFTGDLLIVVWVGRDDNKPTRISGSLGALKIWGQIVKALQPKSLELFEPEGIVWAWVDKTSGKLSSERCEGAVKLPFKRGALPYRYEPKCFRDLPRRGQGEEHDDRPWWQRWF